MTIPTWSLSNNKPVLVTQDPIYTHSNGKDGRFLGREPHNYLPLAIFICFINPLMGPIAILFSVMSSRAYRAGDLRYAYKWGNYSFFTAIMAIVVSVILGIALGFSLSRLGVMGGHYFN